MLTLACLDMGRDTHMHMIHIVTQKARKQIYITEYLLTPSSLLWDLPSQGASDDRFLVKLQVNGILSMLVHCRVSVESNCRKN